MNQKSYEQIKKYCEKHHLIRRGDKILVGLSGGADSVYLLTFLAEMQKEYGLKLYVVHVNHGIRGEEALADETFAKAYAEQLQLDFELVSLDIPGMAAEQKMSEEEAGRYYRYQSFRRIMEREGCSKIAVAHHREDQAETLLFQLLRGSGLRGLGGIRPQQDGIIRPLLQTSRQQIEAELTEAGIPWREDSTNQQMAYARNKLRKQVIPYLQREFQPETVEHLAGTAEQLQEVWDYFYRQVREEYAALRQEEKGFSGDVLQKRGITFRRDVFLRIDPVLQPYVLLEALAESAGSRKDIGRVHVRDMMKLIQGETGKRLSLPYGLRAGRDYEQVWIRGDYTAEQEEACRQEPAWQIEQHICFRHELSERNLKNNCTKCFDYARIKNGLVWRHPLPGDELVIDRQGHKKKLSRIMLDAKVPREKRKQLWVLAEGDSVLWVPELQRSNMRYYVTDETEKVLVVELRMRE